MYISVNNKKIKFATHIITVNGDISDKNREQIPYQIEDNNKIIVYSSNELIQAQQTLTQLEISYSTDSQNISQELKDKVQNIKFQSRSEAIRYIENNKVPESEVIPTLAKKLIDTELENFELKQDNNILGNTIVDLELRLLQLEVNN